MPNWKRGVSGPQRKYIKKSIDAKQNKQIKKLKTDVKKLKQSEEVKYLDRPISFSPSTTPVLSACENLVVFGGNQSLRHEQREGQQITILSYRCKGMVQILPQSTSPDNDNRVRLMLVLTKDSSTVSSITDVLQSNNIDSMHRIKPEYNYKVLYDRIYNLQNTTGTNQSYGGNPFRLPIDIRLGKKAFGKTGSKASWEVLDQNISARRGSLTLIMFSDSAVISHPYVRMNTRLRYLDQ